MVLGVLLERGERAIIVGWWDTSPESVLVILEIVVGGVVSSVVILDTG